MSERDLPDRLRKYGGDHLELRRIALLKEDLVSLPSFPASDKKEDTRFHWFHERFGDRCWELDAMDPSDLRKRVEEEVWKWIEPVAWQRCEVVNSAEQESLQTILSGWTGGAS
jgi:hypothetical protein